MNLAEGKQIRLAIGDSRDVGDFIIGLESIKDGKAHFRVLAKDGGIPWESEPPANLKYLTSKARAVT